MVINGVQTPFKLNESRYHVYLILQPQYSIYNIYEENGEVVTQ